MGPFSRIMYRIIHYEPARKLVYGGEGNGELPPKHLMNLYGPSPFQVSGRQIVDFLIASGLQPNHHVLDVGCGAGRIALPLSKYLTTGSYHGLDIVPEGLAWCDRHISSKHPNFKFQQMDVYNKAYHPKGSQKANEYRFPFEDHVFDCIVLTSVFTHMIVPDIANYLKEFSRLLTPNGKTVITYFLLNSDSRAKIHAGLPTIKFPFKFDSTSYVRDPDVPEDAIAHDENAIQELYIKAGLRIESTIYGAWRDGKPETDFSFQDKIISPRV